MFTILDDIFGDWIGDDYNEFSRRNNKRKLKRHKCKASKPHIYS